MDMTQTQSAAHEAPAAMKQEVKAQPSKTIAQPEKKLSIEEDAILFARELDAQGDADVEKRTAQAEEEAEPQDGLEEEAEENQEEQPRGKSRTGRLTAKVKALGAQNTELSAKLQTIMQERDTHASKYQEAERLANELYYEVQNLREMIPEINKRYSEDFGVELPEQAVELMQERYTRKNLEAQMQIQEQHRNQMMKQEQQRQEAQRLMEYQQQASAYISDVVSQHGLNEAEVAEMKTQANLYLRAGVSFDFNAFAKKLTEDRAMKEAFTRLQQNTAQVQTSRQAPMPMGGRTASYAPDNEMSIESISAWMQKEGLL
jgi:type III secretory pathway component EscV